MACQREVLGQIVALQEVVQFLEGNLAKHQAHTEDTAVWQDGDPASWAWADEEDRGPAQRESAAPPLVGPDWLDAATVAVSPLADVLALATARRLVLLTAQWDSENCQSRFVISAKVEVPEAAVTSLLCLPLASSQRSSSGAADWTCLVVGQESGHVTFYTEDGSLLFSQRLHQTGVRSISCCSRQVSAVAAEEELTVVFEDALVVLEGFVLYQTLRGCRNQLARVRAAGGSGLEVPPLVHTKWELRKQEWLETAEKVGFRSSSLFDHLQEESLRQPAGSVTSGSVPAGALLVTTGRCPFVGFFHAAEGVEQARLDLVFRGVASKVKDTLFSTIGSFWTGGSDQRDAAKLEPDLGHGTPVQCKFGLPDVQRQGQLTAMSRDRQLCAVTDSFGRVTLIDNHRGLALAMWKGYRDAQCGWLEVREPRPCSSDGRPGGSGRRARFLALYAPRRGILELWSAVGGPKVAAFNVSKHGRLMNVAHGLLGLPEQEDGRKSTKLLQCVFFSPDGRLTTLNAPFHLALSEQNSRRVHNQHLLRELRAQLRNPPPEVGQYLRCQLLALKTAGARHQALESIVTCRRLARQDIETALDTVLDSYSVQEPSNLDHESHVLLQLALAYKRLLTTFSTLETLASAPPAYQSSDTDITAEDAAELLRLSPCQAAELICRLDSVDEPRARVTFADRQLGPAAFLRCFEVSVQHGAAAVGVKDAITDEQKHRLAGLLFGVCLTQRQPPPEWCRSVLHCGLSAGQLLSLLALSWLSCDSPLRTVHLTNLTELLITLLSDSGGEAGMLCWSVQQLITEASRLRRALALATVCRAVTVRLEEKRCASSVDKRHYKASEANEDSSSEVAPVSGDWEQLTEQTVSWDLLLHQLSDVTSLCDVIPAAHRADITLQTLLKRGPGAVSELTARWLLSMERVPDFLTAALEPTDGTAAVADCQASAPAEDAPETTAGVAAVPALAADPTARETKETEWDRETVSPDTEEGRKYCQIQDGLARIAVRFPHSVRPDTLLLNCAWEEAAAWNRHREHTDRLQRAVQLAARISNAHIRYGGCSLLWSAVVRRPCAIVAGLLQRSGHRPDDLLCGRELQLSALQLPHMLDSCSALLEQLLKALVTSEVERPPLLYTDNLWAVAAGPDSLLNLAAGQRPCSEDLAALQLQAVDVMRAQVHLDLRGVQPYDCFSARDGESLFGDLSAQYQSPAAVDQAVRSKREALLNRWVSAAVRLVSETADGQAELQETASWVRRCREVARGWNISEDVVRRQYTLDLYNAGHDRAAQEVLLSLSNAAGLASQLLLLAGARVRHYIYTSSDMMPLLAQLSINCADFVQIADVPLDCPAVPLDHTLMLLRHVVRLKPESVSEHRLALEMVDLVGSLAAGATNTTTNQR